MHIYLKNVSVDSPSLAYFSDLDDDGKYEVIAKNFLVERSSVGRRSEKYDLDLDSEIHIFSDEQSARAYFDTCEPFSTSQRVAWDYFLFGAAMDSEDNELLSYKYYRNID